MPQILNNTEAHLTAPLMGEGINYVKKQKVVEGHLIEEIEEVPFPKVVETLVLEPRLSTTEPPEPTEITKTQLKELRKMKTFEAWEEKRTISVVGE